MFDKILIANRGEIACRIARTARRLGVRTVAVYSDADAAALHVRSCDEALPIGGPRPAESYLRADAVIEAARRSGAQAVHPGYGFLSENADFADACERAGLAFIGPSSASMRRMGSKAGAKELMAAHGVPVVPGYTGEDQDPAHLAREAARIGYPLMIKAAHGGGGKGMRIVRDAADFAAALESCQREARNAFGRDRVLLERYIERPRHIEIQIFGDRHGGLIHLGERECSAQRRYQKVIEETPSPFLDAAARERMGAAAVAAGRALDYVNAGTVEFIVGQDGAFYFMEINTRLQVEHPVTEQVLGVDLVEWQLRIAAGEALPWRQDQVRAQGHAIEVRLYAEDPEKNFLPGSGRLERLALPPPGPHVRVDAGVVEGDAVTIFYDPMIAKLVVHDRDRPAALTRLREALAATEIAGPRSNVEFLERLVRHPAVVEGTIDTGYLDRHLDEVLPQPAPPDDHALFAAVALALLDDERESAARAAATTDPHSPWARADAWRPGHAGRRLAVLGWRGERHEVSAHGHGGHYRLDCAGRGATVADAVDGGAVLGLAIDGRRKRYGVLRAGLGFTLHDGDRRLRFEHLRAFAFEAGASTGADRLNAPMPGRIVDVRLAAGGDVVEGQELLVMEAMKMEITLRAPRAGRIAPIAVAAGDFVEADAVLVRYTEDRA
jgi:3-methylcrotonyl-CoA carboxylase alpha subunit